MVHLRKIFQLHEINSSMTNLTDTYHFHQNELHNHDPYRFSSSCICNMRLRQEMNNINQPEVLLAQLRRDQTYNLTHPKLDLLHQHILQDRLLYLYNHYLCNHLLEVLVDNSSIWALVFRSNISLGNLYKTFGL